MLVDSSRVRSGEKCVFFVHAGFAKQMKNARFGVETIEILEALCARRSIFETWDNFFSADLHPFCEVKRGFVDPLKMIPWK
jgi:hypothetical protein